MYADTQITPQPLPGAGYIEVLQPLLFMSVTRQSFSHGVSPAKVRLAKSLGWFSIGLGLAEILVPRALARAIGIRPNPGLFAALGVRELVAGIGILTQRRPAGFMWSRVAGDLMDLALLGTAFTSRHTDKEKAAVAVASVVGVTAADVVSALQLSSATVPPNGRARGFRVEHRVSINRSQEELYNFWRNFENLPKIMGHVESVTVLGESRSRWVVKGPAGKKVHWDAVIIQDKENESIGWRTLQGAEVDHAGIVRFEPSHSGSGGTLVSVKIDYYPPAGILGAWAAKLFGQSPEGQVEQDLKSFKQLMETGGVTATQPTKA